LIYNAIVEKTKDSFSARNDVVAIIIEGNENFENFESFLSCTLLPIKEKIKT